MHRDSLLWEPNVIIFRAIFRAVYIFELMIDRQSSYTYQLFTLKCVYPSFSFFLFQISVFRSLIPIRCFPGDVQLSDVSEWIRDVGGLWGLFISSPAQTFVGKILETQRVSKMFFFLYLFESS